MKGPSSTTLLSDRATRNEEEEEEEKEEEEVVPRKGYLFGAVFMCRGYGNLAPSFAGSIIRNRRGPPDMAKVNYPVPLSSIDSVVMPPQVATAASSMCGRCGYSYYPTSSEHTLILVKSYCIYFPQRKK